MLGLPAVVAVVRIAAATTTVAGGAPVVAGTSFVDGEGATLHFPAVQGRDCGLGLSLVRHLDEAEATRPAGVAVGRYAGGRDGAISRECGLELGLARVEAEISYVNVQDVFFPLTAPSGVTSD